MRNNPEKYKRLKELQQKNVSRNEVENYFVVNNK